jgi:5-methylcytosine-specific restriction protein B
MMARKTKSGTLDPVISVAQSWVRRCLIENGSVFSEVQLWAPENIAEVREAFVDNPDESDSSFAIKLKGQMNNASESAKQLMAEMMWALLLFPSNITTATKRKQVRDLWVESGKEIPMDHPLLSDDVLTGIGSGGPGFNNHRWRELVYLITLAEELKTRATLERKKIFADYASFVNWIDGIPQKGHRQFRHMLRFFCFPDQVERMSSNSERRAVLLGFEAAPKKDVKVWDDRRLDEELLLLRQKLELKYPGEILDFYEPPLRDQWKPTLLMAADDEAVTGPHFWVEKTIAKNRTDRLAGNNSVGQALWSPQRDASGGDIYKQMRNVKPGDIVFHLVDNQAINGFSIVESEADDTFRGVDGTEWADRPSYRIQLNSYREISPAINRSSFLEDDRYRPILDQLLKTQRGLFFNRNYELRQGAYLTEAPLKLVQVLNDISLRKSGLPLQLDLDIPPLDVEMDGQRVSSAPFDSQAFDSLHDLLIENNFQITKKFLVRFVSALTAKPFLILTGNSGTGKTKLGQAFSAWISSSMPNANFEVVPVGADWTGNENILGYPDGLSQGSYVSKPALSLVLRAAENPRTPYFLILDEMNLSHVERYFSDILSSIESGAEIPLYQSGERRAGTTLVPSRVMLPKNLFVIGTVNVDETTYMFSPKVLDRANVIEFRISNEEMADFLKKPGKINLAGLHAKGKAYSSEFLNLATSQVEVPQEVREAYEHEMLEFFDVLQSHGVEFGYRVAHESARFVYFYKALGDDGSGGFSWFLEAFDCVVVQKFLPKLHGSRGKLAPLLQELWVRCTGEGVAQNRDENRDAKDSGLSTAIKSEPSVKVPDGARFPLSAGKIGRMWRLLSENGFASFAEA